MLIKYSGHNKFIFIANPKCASSSIEESVVGRIADIRIMRTPLGKHMSIEDIYKRFNWIFEHQEFSLDKFFKWGIIRDPIKRVVSWYNYRSIPTLKNRNKYTGDLSFNDFWNINKTTKLLQPQYNNFFDINDKSIKVDYLCRQECLLEDFLKIRDILGVNLSRFPKSHISTTRTIEVNDIEESLKKEIKEYHAIDYELIENLKSLNLEGLHKFQHFKQEIVITNPVKTILRDVLSKIHL